MSSGNSTKGGPYSRPSVTGGDRHGQPGGLQSGCTVSGAVPIVGQLTSSEPLSERPAAHPVDHLIEGIWSAISDG
jgi:hypothetical protein